MAAAVVADGAADGLGDGGEVANQFPEGFAREFGGAFEGFVEVRDVGGVVLAVVDFHRAGVDVRLKRGGGVGKCW